MSNPAHMSDQPLFDAFGSIVDRAYDGCTARQVAQIVHILIGTAASWARPPAAVAAASSLSPRTVAISSNETVTISNGAPKTISGERLHVGGIAGSQREPSIGRLGLKNAATSLANSWEERSVNSHNLYTVEFVLNESVERKYTKFNLIN